MDTMGTMGTMHGHYRHPGHLGHCRTLMDAHGHQTHHDYVRIDFIYTKMNADKAAFVFCEVLNGETTQNAFG